MIEKYTVPRAFGMVKEAKSRKEANKMNKKIVHDALILFAFTIVLGLLLGVVYGVTKPSIDKVNEEKTQNAYKQVFTDADHFTDYADFDADAAQALLDENGYSDEIETVVAAQDASENTLGYVFTVTAKDGSQDLSHSP